MSFGSPNAFLVGYHQAMEDIRAIKERNASLLANFKAIIRKDREKLTVRMDSASEASVRRSYKRSRRRSKTKFRDYSDMSIWTRLRRR